MPEPTKSASRAGIPQTAIEDMKQYIDAADRAVKQDLKVWVMGSIMAAAMLVAAPGVGMVFYLGNMSSKMDAAFSVQSRQQTTLEQRGDWMHRRERVEESLVAWALTKGYVPSEPVR